MMSEVLSEVTLNEPVTKHMRASFTHLLMDQTVGEALANLRERQPAGRFIYFYVLDNENRLRGVVPTRRLLLSNPDKPIADIMVRHVIAIPRAATVLDACEFFTLHRFLCFPVVDEERRIVGMVDVELYTGELNELDTSPGREDDLFQLIGVHLAKARITSPLAAFRNRFPWLLCNLAGGIVAAFLSGMFQAELDKAVALAFFIPAVLALAESVGIQSFSLALQVLHGKPTFAALLHKIRWEVLTGLLLGGATGLLLTLVAWAWLGQTKVTLCLLGGIVVGVTCAAVVGVAVPNLLRIFRQDPRVAAGPIALALADTLTLLVYFNFARWLLA